MNRQIRHKYNTKKCAFLEIQAICNKNHSNLAGQSEKGLQMYNCSLSIPHELLNKGIIEFISEDVPEHRFSGEQWSDKRHRVIHRVQELPPVHRAGERGGNCGSGLRVCG